MRSILSLLILEALIYTAYSATVDASTADWVLQVVCTENDGKLNLNPTTDTESRPPCTKKEEGEKKNDAGFNLNPTIVDKYVDCMTKDRMNGICVLYYQCNSTTKTIIDDGASILDVRLNVCPHYLEVCCKQEEAEPFTEKTVVKDESADRFNTPDNPPGQVSSTTTPASTTKAPKKWSRGKPKREGCGWSNPGVGPKLRSSEVGETSPYAQYGDFPWMVAVMKKTSDDDVWSDGDYLGGGTLIHPSVVLTVAHKLSIKSKQLKANELKCRAGEWDTQTTFELFPHQDRDVARYIIHEDYYRISLLNDVALLIMKEPFDLMNNADHMGTACLATSLPPPGYNCYSMGWGKEFNKKGKSLPSVLKKVQLKLVEHDVCQDDLVKTRLGKLFELHESLTCARGDPGVDTCRGDGGSSLVCPLSTDAGERRFAVYGMVCYGIGKCGDAAVPGVYVNIPHVKSWIDTQMQNEGFGTSYYTI